MFARGALRLSLSWGCRACWSVYVVLGLPRRVATVAIDMVVDAAGIGAMLSRRAGPPDFGAL